MAKYCVRHQRAWGRVTYKRLVRFVSIEAKQAMDPQFVKEALAKLASNRKITPGISTQRPKLRGSFAVT